MTERGHRQVQRTPRSFRIGPSQMHWEGDTLCVSIDEVSVPWPSRVRGSVRLHAPRRFDHTVCLSEQGGHTWSPIAPVARVEVSLSQPSLNWQGQGYLDANRGDAPLEQAFERWDWSRAHLSDQRSVVLYDVVRVAQPPLHIGLSFETDQTVRSIDAPPTVAMPASGWRIKRSTRCDPDGSATVLRTLTDAPFYTRTLLNTRLLGEEVSAMHESLCLRRFSSGLVQAMLPFRMPRRTA